MQLTKIQLQRLNQVRIHFRITLWLKKISKMNKTKIRNHILKHQADKQEYKPTPGKPYQQSNSNTVNWKILDHQLIQQEITPNDANALLPTKQLLGDGPQSRSTISAKATRNLYSPRHHTQYQDAVLFPKIVGQFIVKSTAKCAQRVDTSESPSYPCQQYKEEGRSKHHVPHQICSILVSVNQRKKDHTFKVKKSR